MTNLETNPTRAKDYIAHHPGAAQAAIAEHLGIHVQTANRILADLTSTGEIHHIPTGGYCLPEHTPTPRAPRTLSAVARRRAIMDWITTEHVSPTQRELATAFQCSLSAIQKDLRLLIDGGAVQNTGGHRGLVPTGLPWVETVTRHDARRVWPAATCLGEGAVA